jgi:hypothetical protein
MDFSINVGLFSAVLANCQTAVTSLQLSRQSMGRALCVADVERGVLSVSVTGLSGHFKQEIKAQVREPGAVMLSIPSVLRVLKLSDKGGVFGFDLLDGIPGHEADGAYYRLRYPVKAPGVGDPVSVQYAKADGSDMLVTPAKLAISPLCVDWSKARSIRVPAGLFTQASELFDPARSAGVKAKEMQVHLDIEAGDEIWFATTSGAVTAIFRAAVAVDGLEGGLQAAVPFETFGALPALLKAFPDPMVDVLFPLGPSGQAAAVKVVGVGWECYVETVSAHRVQPNPRKREWNRQLPVQANVVVTRTGPGGGQLLDLLRQAEAFRASGIAVAVDRSASQLTIKASSLIGRCDLIWPIIDMAEGAAVPGDWDIVLQPRTIRAAVDALPDEGMADRLELQFLAGAGAWEAEQTAVLALRSEVADGSADALLYLAGTSR